MKQLNNIISVVLIPLKIMSFVTLWFFNLLIIFNKKKSHVKLILCHVIRDGKKIRGHEYPQVKSAASKYYPQVTVASILISVSKRVGYG